MTKNDENNGKKEESVRADGLLLNLHTLKIKTEGENLYFYKLMLTNHEKREEA